MASSLMNCRIRNFVAVVGLCAGAIPCALAAETAVANGDGYVVMSLLGNELSIVSSRSSISSALDKNYHQEFALSDQHFDTVAVRTASALIHRLDPAAHTRLLVTADPAVFARAAAGVDSELDVKSLIAPIEGDVRSGDPHYLLILTKYRADARIRFRDDAVGRGKLSGLGFYLDRETRSKNVQTGEHADGFCAPYAYITATLVDLKTGRPVRSDSAAESSMRVVYSSAESVDPWDTMTADQKIRAIDTLIRRAVERTVPHVIAPT